MLFRSDLDNYSAQAIFKRYNFRANVDVDITKDFFLKVDLASRITDRNAPGTTANRVVQICNTQPSYLPITLGDNGHEDNRQYLADNDGVLLYGDAFHRWNLLGELAHSGYLNEKKTFMNGSFSLGHKLDFITKGLKIEGVFSYDAEEGRWINRVMGTYSGRYREFPNYATFMPVEGQDIYMNNPNYTGKYKT